MKAKNTKSMIGSYKTYLNDLKKRIAEIDAIDKDLSEIKEIDSYNRLNDMRFNQLQMLERDARELTQLINSEIAVCIDLGI